jgi:hypothetical protein
VDRAEIVNLVKSELTGRIPVLIQQLQGDDGGPTVVPKTATETVNNSATLQDDDELAVTVDTGTVCKVELWLMLSAAGTAADWKFAWSVPSGGEIYWGPISAQAGDSGWVRNQAATTPGGLLVSTDSLPAGSMNGRHGVMLAGIYVGGGTAGDLQFQWAQNTADASDSKVLANSVLIAQKVN